MTTESNQLNFNNSGGIVNRQTPKVTENGQSSGGGGGSNASASNNNTRNVSSNQVNINNSGGVINSGGSSGGTFGTVLGTIGTADNFAKSGVFIPSSQGEGAYIRAIAPGTVMDAGYHSGMGNHAVVIQYNNGTHVMYGYNRIHYVNPGDTVNVGDVIAEVGCQGACAETANQVPGALIKAASSFQGLTSGTGLLDPMQEFAKLTNNNRRIAPRANRLNPIALRTSRNPTQPNPQSSGSGTGTSSSSGSNTSSSSGIDSSVTPQALQTAQQNSLMVDFFDTFRIAVGGPFTWGNGHGDNMTPEDAYNSGADSTGIFNIIRRAMGLPEIGSLPEYYSFLANKVTFNSGTPYPPGTIIMNPGLEGEGHMAMILNWDKNIAESYGEGGISITRTSYNANQSFTSGFTIAGEMPDLGTVILPVSVASTSYPPSKKSATSTSPTQPDGQGGFTSQAATSSSSFRAMDTTGGGSSDGSNTGGGGSSDQGSNSSNNSGQTYQQGLDTVINYVQACVGALYIENMHPIPCGAPPEDVVASLGANCSGLIDSALCYAGLGDLIPGDGAAQCGSTPTSGTETWGPAFADNPIDASGATIYDPGTIVVAPPGFGEGSEGHMAIVTGDNNMLTEATTYTGHVSNFRTIQESQPYVDYQYYGTPAGTTTSASGSRVGGKGGNSTQGGAGGAGDDEPCIMKNPLGVFRLQDIMGKDSLGKDNSLLVYTAALNNGDMWTSATVQKIYCGMNSELGFGKTICGVTTDEKSRDWTQLGYSLYQPFKRTVDEVAAAAMYDYCSIGTGEIVFWYPDIIVGMQDNVAQMDPTGNMTPQGRKRYLDNLPQQEYYDYFRGMSPAQISKMAPWLTQQQVVDIINYLRANPPASETNLQSTQALQQLSDPNNIAAGSGKNVDVLTAPIILKDTDLVDFHLTVSDDELVTHLYVMGDFRMAGIVDANMPLEIVCQRWSTIFEHPFLNKRTEQWTFNPYAFAFKYGLRSMKVEKNAIKTPGLAQVWAENEFLKRWLNCYKVDLETAYLPMAYPGQRIIVESLGVVLIIFEAEHTFGSEWSTKLSCGFPLMLASAANSSPIPKIPFWALGNTNDVKNAGPQIINGKAEVPENPTMYDFANDPLKQGSPLTSQAPNAADFQGKDGLRKAHQDYQKGISGSLQNIQDFYRKFNQNNPGG